MMRISLIDAATRPLQGIKKELGQVKQVAGAGFAQLAGGGAAIAAGAMAIKAALGPAIEMDRALGEVASLDVSQTGLQLLGEEALRFSVEYGKSATEFVRASYDIQSAIGGLSEQELPAFTRASAVLAAATKADTGTITSYMGTMYGIFEQQAAVMGKAEWVEAVAGKTATAVQMFKTTGQGMADAFQGVQSTATSLGISMDEQFAVLGTLQATMGGAVAGTAYKSFLSAIPKAGKELGLGFYDAAGAMLPMVDVLDQIKGKFGDVLDGSDIAALQKAFGETATPVILNLLSKTDALGQSIDALGQARGMDKATLMAAAMTDQYERVEAAWFAIRAALFSAVLPSINKVVGVFADGAGVVLRWTRIFPNITKLVAYTALAIAGLGIVTGTWLVLAGVAKLATLAWALTFGKVTLATGLLTGALKWLRTTMLAVNMAFALNPVAWIVGGLIALVAAVVLAIAYWDELCAAFAIITSFELITEFLSGIADTLGPMAAQSLAPLIECFTIIAGLLWEGVTWLGGLVAGLFKTTSAIDGVADSGRTLGTVLGHAFDLLLTPWRMLIKLIKTALDLANLIPGIDIDTSGLDINVLPAFMQPDTPALAAPAQVVNSPLASYRQQGASAPPVGGLGQQLIQKNASVTAARQPPAKTLSTGDVHMYVQNPLTPEQLSNNVWMEQRG
ncbi:MULTISPECIES: phage tail tape measure protein [Aeromonas]|uniref:phage tail tape measure protein n=1 Tax=Aeromonas TaxID=642 RepID=UPI0022EABC4B|nr:MULTISPECIES: phage tail tape measure protein [Aeromonas]MDA3317863.1 phage tail tape measure protein [Aeromonas sp. PI_26]